MTRVPIPAELAAPICDRAAQLCREDVMLGGLGVLTPGSRVGLPYNGTMIPGVVTHFSPDSQVGVRWHDGQHSVEDPGDIRPL